MIRKIAVRCLLFCFLCLWCVGCNNGSLFSQIPDSATLLSPSDNTACLQSKISIRDTTALVTFKWSPAINANEYQVEITNLSTKKKINYNTLGTSFSIELPTDNSYSWDVVSINTNGSVTSPVWSFYLTGNISNNYAPFPATLKSPLSGSVLSSGGLSSVNVSFQWTCNDIDGDISSYDLYCDNKDASTKISSLKINNTTQTLARGKTYYWKIVAIDKLGNTSTSTVGIFRID